ncbi:hypothetical protein PtA15_2A146 [Puccinia triticina]|uniref:Uncharacterized protein n=1 Tax=Puccinia triticina TaxID=208348 RepID=A0ABY7CAX7_9BASI|nr:uncharacterized protein PtA15_2A146 [Puccinia triticina]WAQ81834.1 hypothetical protein PtA15_2A146 [Puccinia triticina]WAR52722.1 hypothetical protein PtB15_2B147 [Puccinia triticina]
MKSNGMIIRGAEQKFNLVMNYAEELHQKIASGFVGRIRRNGRARKEQLEEIAFLFCEVMTVNYLVTPEQVDHHIGLEILEADLPIIIKHKTCKFSQFLRDGIEKAFSTGPEHGRATHKDWDIELWNAFENVQAAIPISFENLPGELQAQRKKFGSLNGKSFQSILSEGDPQYSGSVMVTLGQYGIHGGRAEIIPMYNTPEVWGPMKKATEREFGTISEENAKILIRSLKRTQRFIQNIPVFDRIYYAMNQVKPFERSNLLRDVEARFEKSKDTKKMSNYEIKTLNRLLQLIINHSEKMDYPAWKKNVFRGFYYLPNYCVKTLGDIFSDCLRNLLLEGEYFRGKTQRGHWIEPDLIYKEIEQKWLLENTKVAVDWLVESFAEARIQSGQEEFMMKRGSYELPTIKIK